VTNTARRKRYEVRVRAMATGIEVATSPKALVFGPDAPRAGLPDIEVRGDENLEVVRLTCDCPDIWEGTLKNEPGSPACRQLAQYLAS